MNSDFRLSHVLQWPVLLYLIVSSSYIVSNEKLPQTKSRSALHIINLMLVTAFILYPIFTVYVEEKTFIRVQFVLWILSLITSLCIAGLEYTGGDVQRNDKLDKKLKVNARLAIANVFVLLLLYLIQKDFTGLFYKREKQVLHRSQKQTRLGEAYSSYIEKQDKSLVESQKIELGHTLSVEKSKEEEEEADQILTMQKLHNKLEDQDQCLEKSTEEELQQDPLKCTQFELARCIINELDNGTLNKDRILRSFVEWVKSDSNDYLKEPEKSKLQDFTSSFSKKGFTEEQHNRNKERFEAQIREYGSKIYDEVIAVKDSPDLLLQSLKQLLDCEWIV